MAAVALAVSLGVAALGALGVASPEALLGVVGAFATPIGLHAAAAIRLVFGAALFLAAPTSRAPSTARILGVTIFVAGLLTPFIGLERITELLDWWSGLGPGFLRAWGAVAFAVGLLLAYTVFPRPRAAS
jgi:hypothetical protein